MLIDLHSCMQIEKWRGNTASSGRIGAWVRVASARRCHHVAPFFCSVATIIGVATSVCCRVAVSMSPLLCHRVGAALSVSPCRRRRVGVAVLVSPCRCRRVGEGVTM
eukprot:1392803-Amorphochlora_amoeboformis.AAC.3